MMRENDYNVAKTLRSLLLETDNSMNSNHTNLKTIAKDRKLHKPQAHTYEGHPYCNE